MNRVTGGFLTAAIGVGLAVAWVSGAFGPLIAQVTGLVRGSAAGSIAPASAAVAADGPPLSRVA